MENQILLEIAKKSIERKFDSNIKIDENKLLKDFPELKELGATFVTLKLNNELEVFSKIIKAKKQSISWKWAFRYQWIIWK